MQRPLQKAAPGIQKRSYRPEKFYTDRWAFADTLKKLHDQGMCVESLAGQFSKCTKTVVIYLKLAETFPPELRYDFLAPSNYLLFRFSDPIKALELVVELHQLAPKEIGRVLPNSWFDEIGLVNLETYRTGLCLSIMRDKVCQEPYTRPVRTVL